MTAWDVLGPFQPGPGGMPPYLAGRETEQDLFRALLQRLRDRGPLPSEVILYGPRGNGKTVLLGWLRDEAAASEIETAVLLPGEIFGVARLAELLSPRGWWRRLVPGGLGVAGLSWTKAAEGTPERSVVEVLAARARKATGPAPVTATRAEAQRPLRSGVTTAATPTMAKRDALLANFT